MEKRTKDNPWQLKTPPLSSDYEMYMDVKDGLEVIVCTVGKTVLLYDARCLTDLHETLKTHGDWMDLGGRRRAKRSQRGNGRSLGKVGNESCWRLVWLEKRASRPFWHVCSAADGSAWAGRIGA